MKRNNKEEKYKAYLRKLDEYTENHVAQRALGYKKLDKPIHYGYEVYWDLRDDISRREDADIIRELLDTYSIPMWCQNPDGTSRNWRKNGTHEVLPEWRHIPIYRWDRVNPAIQKWFELKEGERSWGVTYYHYALFIPPFWLEKKVRKYYKTHYKVIDEILLQEEAEIKGDLWGKYYDYYVFGAYYWRDSTSTYKKINNRKFRNQNKQILRKNMSKIGTESEHDFLFDLEVGYACENFEEHTYKRDKW